MSLFVNYLYGVLEISSKKISILELLKNHFAHIYETYKIYTKPTSWRIFISESNLLLDTCEKMMQNLEASCSVLEHDIVGYSYTLPDEGWYCGINKEWALYLHISKKEIEIYGANDKICYDFIRKISRQIIRSDLVDVGCINVHSSAIDINGAGVIFYGGKGSGKTTAMFKLLSTGEVGYIANDCTVITPYNEIMPVLAGPNVGLGTLNSISKYQHLIPEEYREHIKEIKDLNKMNEIYSIKIRMDIEDVTDIIGVEIKNKSILKAIFFVNIITNDNDVKLVKATKDYSYKELLKQINEDTKDHGNWLKINTEDRPDYISRITELIDSVCCFRLAIGTRSGESVLLDAIKQCLYNIGVKL